MAKTITFVTAIILIYTLFNYPINKGYPLLVLIICLVILCFSAAKIYSDYQNFEEEETFENVEKKTNEIEQNNGIFEYKNDGFYIKQKSMNFIKWNEIESITHFNINMLKGVYQNGIEIVTNNKIYKIHNDDNQTTGIEKFEIEMNKNLVITEIYDSEVLFDGSSRTPLYIKPSV